MRIAIAQLNYKIGDFVGNFQKIAQAIENQADKCDLLIFSELCLCGYYPKDLIDQPDFIEAQNKILDKLIALTKKHSLAIIIGFIERNPGKGKPFFNSLCLISHGERLFTYHKKLLPVYNIFNEARHFSPGKELGIFQFKDFSFGFLICEDGWAGNDNYLYECDPVKDLASHSLDMIISINGSPSNIGKQQERIERFCSIAKRCSAPLLFINQVGGNDDILFDGASFVVDKEGNLLANLLSFEEQVGSLTLEKKALTLSKDFVPYTPMQNAELFYQQAILGLKDYVEKCGFNKVVLGVSGGIDSALTLALAVKALGNERVIGLAMPSQYSSKESLLDATELCDTFKVKLFFAPIEQEFNLALNQFFQFFGEQPHSITEQNIQARLRGRILMEYSNQTGALVLSTGNKSELSVGYTTLYGDMTGGINLIGDLYKTDVYLLAHYYNLLNPTQTISQAILKKPPSAELAPNQKDSDTLPDYAVLDPILKLYIEGDLLSDQERIAYENQIKHLPESIITRVQHLVDAAEFKRKQAAPIIRMQRRAFGYGRQLPIAATYP